MIISIFLHEKQVHIFSEYSKNIFEVTETRKMADNIMCFLKEFLKASDPAEINKFIYPAGPNSFTSVRIITSIAKGLFIANKKTTFLAVSNFLTYIYSANSPSGTIAIPTMRGDHFVAEYENFVIKNKTVKNIDLSNAPNITTISDDIFKNKNFAQNQYDLLVSPIAQKNANFISDLSYIDYGFIPQYSI